jgi:hypothetical protein
MAVSSLSFKVFWSCAVLGLDQSHGTSTGSSPTRQGPFVFGPILLNDKVFSPLNSFEDFLSVHLRVNHVKSDVDSYVTLD